MPPPDRPCLTCLHHRPYEGRLAQTYGKCESPRRPLAIHFAETLRADDSMCGPNGLWWERHPPTFELIDEDRDLDWDDPDEEED